METLLPDFFMHSYSKETSILLNSIYKKYHKSEYIHPDPLEFLSNYKNPEDMEIVALIAYMNSLK